jgi:predicted nicotinamide N-methyase
MKLSINKQCKEYIGYVLKFMAEKGIHAPFLKTLNRKVNTRNSDYSHAEGLVLQYAISLAIETLTKNPRKEDVKLLSDLFYLNDRMEKKSANKNKQILANSANPAVNA